MRTAVATAFKLFSLTVLQSWLVPHLHAEPSLCTPSCWINEFHYDNIGDDAVEFVEIACTADVDLNQWSLYLYNGASATAGAPYDPLGYGTGVKFVSLSSSSSLLNRRTCVDGVFYVVANFPKDGIQNGGNDGFALVYTDPNIIPATPSVVEFLSYEGEMTATLGPAAGRTSVDIGVQEGTSTSVGTSISRVGQGCSATDFKSWIAGLPETRGSNNLCLQQVTGCCLDCPSATPSALPSTAPSSVPSVEPSQSVRPSQAPSSGPSARPSKSKKRNMMTKTFGRE